MTSNNNKESKSGTNIWPFIIGALVLYALFHDRTEENKRKYQSSLQIYNQGSRAIASDVVDACYKGKFGNEITMEECDAMFDDSEKEARERLAPQLGIKPADRN